MISAAAFAEELGFDRFEDFLDHFPYKEVYPDTEVHYINKVYYKNGYFIDKQGRKIYLWNFYFKNRLVCCAFDPLSRVIYVKNEGII